MNCFEINPSVRVNKQIIANEKPPNAPTNTLPAGHRHIKNIPAAAPATAHITK